MPTSPAPGGKSGPSNAVTDAPASSNGAQTSGGGSTVRALPAEGQQQRPGEKRAREEDSEDLTGIVVRIGSGAQPKTLARLRSTEPPKASVEGGEPLPEAFRPAPDEAAPDVPQAAQGSGTTVEGQGGRVLVTQGRGGRGPGRVSAGQREPSEGRENFRRDPLRTRRGPKKTYFQRRFSASRPTGFHAQLNPWDLSPMDVRSTAAGQERAIFRTRGFLVTHFDFPLYRILYTFNVGLIATVFPTPPQWWPSDWGTIPIPLPWEIAFYRSDLVSADAEDPVWYEVYQKFLEQLAGGWDLYYGQSPDKSTLSTFPPSIAKALVDKGAFAFCAGRSPSQSLRKFCELHSIDIDGLPDQRVAKNSSWEKISDRKARKNEKDAKRSAALVPAACTCRERVSRAARRLGLEAQILEVVSSGPPLDASETVERLCSLTSAAMSYSIEAARLLERLEETMATARRDNYSRDLDDALGMIRAAPELSDYLPRRFARNLARVGPGA